MYIADADGFIWLLIKFRTMPRDHAQFHSVFEELQSYLCTNPTTSCLLLDFPATKKTYFKSPIKSHHPYLLFDYIFLHMLTFVIRTTLFDVVGTLIVDRPQRILALSTQPELINNPTSLLLVPILQHHHTVADVLQYSPQIVICNCYDSIAARTNFQMRCEYRCKLNLVRNTIF